MIWKPKRVLDFYWWENQVLVNLCYAFIDNFTNCVGYVWIKAGLTTERYSVQVIFIRFLVHMNPAYRRVQQQDI